MSFFFIADVLPKQYVSHTARKKQRAVSGSGAQGACWTPNDVRRDVNPGAFTHYPHVA